MNHWVPAQAETSTQTPAMNMIAAEQAYFINVFGNEWEVLTGCFNGA